MNAGKGMSMGANGISEDDIFSGGEMAEEVKDESYYKSKLQEVLDTLESGDIETAKAIIMECLAGDLAEEDNTPKEDADLNSIFGGQ